MRLYETAIRAVNAHAAAAQHFAQTRRAQQAALAAVAAWLETDAAPEPTDGREPAVPD